MPSNVAQLPELVTSGDLGDELASFIQTLRAEKVSPNTILAYGGAVRQFGHWLTANGHPTNVSEIQPRHINEWMIALDKTSKPATAHNRWRGIQRFFNWYASIDEDFLSPMRKLRPPRLPRYMPRVLTLEELQQILGTCAGSSFEDRRDNALIRLLFDTGARRHEIAALRWHPTEPAMRDIDLRRKLVHVFGKGSKDNWIDFSDKTFLALDAYRRARAKHPHADLSWWWLGKRGQLTDSGIAQAIRDRGRRVGIADLHAHDFRHAATHHELAGGMNEADVMSKRGWDSPAMLRRYASTTANERAVAASRKLALGDKL